MKALIVEDHAEDLNLLKYNLEWHGYQVFEAGNGLEALEHARREIPDLIVSDALMPVMDGFMLLREVKADPTLREIPFIFYSAVYTGSREQELALALGALAFIAKPKEVDDLWEEISAVLQNRVSADIQQSFVAPPSDNKFLAEYSLIVATRLEQEVRQLEAANVRIAQKEAEYQSLYLQFHAIIDSIPDNITLINKEMHIIWANKGAAEVAGKTPEDLVGRSCHSIWYGRSAPCEHCPVMKCFASGKQVNDTIVRADGRIWEITAVPLADQKSGEISVIEIIRDVTEHKKLENQYLHAQKMESIGTLAGGVAHDFNNILTVIMGYAQLLNMKIPVEDPLRQKVDGILHAADRAAHLTKELLLFSRKQAGKRKPVDLNCIVEKAGAFLRRIIGEDITLKNVLFNGSLPISADSNQLEQVLMNLAVNARDAMAHGGDITLQTERVVLGPDFVATHGYGAPGNYALLTFSDSGEGMDEATRDRIFEPFYTTKDVGKGTGLGLSVVYGIVKQHEGYIVVYSEPGHGTTFRIYLQLVSEEAEDETTRLKDEVSVGGSETILLAEDSEPVRKLMATVLASAGYTVIEAVDGRDAVQKFMDNVDSIQLMLSDCIMPRMNGNEACDEIRKIRPGLKVIFTSGHAPDIIRQKAFTEDITNMVYKPVSPRDLLKKVRNVLDGAT